MKKMICSAVFMSLGLVVSAAVACPCKSKTASKKGKTTVTKVADRAASPCSHPCGQSAKTVADKAKAPCSKDCAKKAKLTAAKDEGCPVAKKVNAILTSLPTMTYRVGEEVTTCSKQAAAMAGASGKAIEFVVGKDVFKNKGEAMVKLTSLLDQKLEDLQVVQFVAGGHCSRCPVTAGSIAKKTHSKVVYRVGGVDFQDKQKAEKVVQLVSEALGKVKTEYKVDGKTFGCSQLAGAKHKESGKEMIYVVGGEETSCPTTAKLLEVKAKVRKVVETAAGASFSL